MRRITCPDSPCWQRTSSGEEADDDVCAMHINHTIAVMDSIEAHLRRSINVSNTLPGQQRAYKEMLNWVIKMRSERGWHE